MAAQMGAIKAGVSVVTFDEKDSAEAFNETLKDSKAKGLILSPGTEVEGEEFNKRSDVLEKLMPELAHHEPGNHLNVSGFPELKQIIQVGHSAIRGTMKFKDCMVYARQKYAFYSMPENITEDIVIESYKGGDKAAEYTSQEINDHAN